MKREKTIVLLVSFAAFAAGVWALYRLHGTMRAGVLAASFALLAAIAVRQTIVRSKKRRK